MGLHGGAVRLDDEDMVFIRDAGYPAGQPQIVVHRPVGPELDAARRHDFARDHHGTWPARNEKLVAWFHRDIEFGMRCDLLWLDLNRDPPILIAALTHLGDHLRDIADLRL